MKMQNYEETLARSRELNIAVDAAWADVEHCARENSDGLASALMRWFATKQEYESVIFSRTQICKRMVQR